MRHQVENYNGVRAGKANSENIPVKWYTLDAAKTWGYMDHIPHSMAQPSSSGKSNRADSVRLPIPLGVVKRGHSAR